MFIKQLSINNFRCFESLVIEFEPKLTVLIAPNGSGKTTILDAVRVALSPYVKGFDLAGKTGKSASIQLSDVRLAPQPNGNMEPQLPSVIKMSGVWSEQITEMTWTQTRERVKPGTGTINDVSAKNLTKWAIQLQQQARSPLPPVTLPLISYLGTSRLWFEGRFTSMAEDVALNTHDYSRTSGYVNCLSSSSSFKAFTTWYGWVYRCYREEQIRALETNMPLSVEGQRFSDIIDVIKTAVDTLITEAMGWHSLEYKASQNQQLVMQHKCFGSIPVDMLSDGVRNAIAVVADLAFRAYKLNPQFGKEAARLTPGIALIDEVDMFLHPSWQQKIAGALLRAFPKVQFIVTTHSPQVLSTVPAECIRVLTATWDEQHEKQRIVVRSVTQQTQGVASSDVMAEVMGTDPMPNLETVRQLSRYMALIQQNLEDSEPARLLYAALVEHYGLEHPLMQECQRLRRLQNLKKRLPPKDEKVCTN